MTSKEIHKLVSIIEDLICFRVTLDEFEKIMPEISELMYHRYCSKKPPVEPVPPPIRNMTDYGGILIEEKK